MVPCHLIVSALRRCFLPTIVLVNMYLCRRIGLFLALPTILGPRQEAVEVESIRRYGVVFINLRIIMLNVWVSMEGGSETTV
jgi:hypothetical protein